MGEHKLKRAKAIEPAPPPSPGEQIKALPPEQRSISVNRVLLDLTGDELIAVIRGVQELPHRIASPLLAKIESQVIQQQGAQPK